LNVKKLFAAIQLISGCFIIAADGAENSKSLYFVLLQRGFSKRYLFHLGDAKALFLHMSDSGKLFCIMSAPWSVALATLTTCCGRLFLPL